MTTHDRSTRKPSKKSRRFTPTNPKEIATMTATTTSPNNTETTADSAHSANVLFIPAPPAEVHIPTPPDGFELPPNARYGTVQPKKAEMVAMPNAVAELRKFADYSATLGKTVPPQHVALQMFDAANQWTTLRTKAAAWDAYCNTQEALAWTGVRGHIKRMKPAFALAAQGDPVLRDTYPNLASLFDAKSEIAHKAVSTKRLNKLAEAEGRPAIHGGVGKKRKRAADRAAGAREAAAPGTVRVGG